MSRYRIPGHGRVDHGAPVSFTFDGKVGKSPRWRTWAVKTVRAKDAGAWTAEVRDGNGALLKVLDFTIE